MPLRQYGCPAGNPWDSDSDIKAAQARTIENRLAEEIIEEQLESVFENECDAGTCDECNRQSFIDSLGDDESEDVLTQQWLTADGIYIDAFGNPLHYEESTDE